MDATPMDVLQFSLENDNHCGRPSALDDDILKVTIAKNLNITTRELAEKLEISKSSIHEYLMKIGYVSCYNVWVPHKLSEQNCMDQYSICDMLLKHNENKPFLKELNSPKGKSFNDLDGVKTHLGDFFSLKVTEFYADGIFKLPARWTKAIENNGNYFNE
ncbi:histone-lysine N-methyltransferase SETMAR-like [Octopus bimaculoides]|uniref:histone-lysine N-methyltransferase SETMAR-like n=1 Tax=Octopus bimaculoides TaxID=37653 RepID=UPI0022E2C802|nr:histone-lysine N-methyltransferase SETMAR-like [Octopus bimaculoides]